jgi:spermidine synthase
VHAGVQKVTMNLSGSRSDKPDRIQRIGLSHSRIWAKHASLLFIGFGSVLSQILLVREFLVGFYGNELSIGIVFACWLLWIGAGSGCGNWLVKRVKKISILFSSLLAVAPLLTFAQVVAVKFVRAVFRAAPGEFLSMADLLGFSFVVLGAGCFVWGMLFTLGAQSLAPEKRRLWLGVNKAYFAESLGSVAGGLFFSFIAGSLLTPLQIVLLIALIGGCVSLWLVISSRSWTPALFPIGAAIVYVVLLRPVQKLERWIDAAQWLLINNQLTFVRSIDTKYQNLSILRLGNQSTVYVDGRPTYSVPNTYDAELIVHSIMVHRTDAQRVLILGGGFNGVLNEVLKYPVREAEYVELDPALLPFVGPVLPAQDRKALGNPRVKSVSADGREYLRQAVKPYDVIFLNVGEPSTAASNRFFTLEFYKLCASRLSQEGFLAITFPSSTEYIADELRDLDASVYQTFKKVFSNILIIPGVRAVLIGSTGTQPLVSQADSLGRRYKAAGISAEFFSEYMYEDLMLPERVSFFTNLLDSIHNYRLNTDANPVTYYFDLLLWNRFLRGDNRFFSLVTRTKIFAAGGFCIGLLPVFLLSIKQKKRREKLALGAVMIVGSTIGMALNLLLLLNFQETFGSVYEMVGAMIAANMFGLACGALAAAWLSERWKWKGLLFAVLAILAGVVLLFPALLNFLIRAHVSLLTFLVTIVAGCLIGMLFGIVNRFYLRRSEGIGSVYAFDVLGSSFGALITCSVLLPVLGMSAMTILFAVFLAPLFLAASLLRR